MSPNPGFERLQAYPFEFLSELLADVTPPTGLSAIPLSVGEPKHTPFAAALEAHNTIFHAAAGKYPPIRGTDDLRTACAGWLERRFQLHVDPQRMVHPVNGTREGLFAIAQALIDPAERAVVAMPNPFYQIYEGAALMAGATPVYLATDPTQHHLPDLNRLSPDLLRSLRLFYLCSPVNPAGTVAPLTYLQRLVELAVEYDFVVVADECYIDIYRDKPPVSLLNAATDMFPNVLAFHSLSKRSNLPGLRSGFVAGDPSLIDLFARYRTYHGCAMSLAVQAASIAAWSDDAHVQDNRLAYNQKFAMAADTLSGSLDAQTPPAAFYLWPEIEGDDRVFCRDLYAHTYVTAVPGRYFAREVDGVNPGAGRIRLSLVADIDNTREALERLAAFCKR
ncbi:MAG: succinyldiaminopimelate transaminase [Pseudomonadota bacterium]